ncbi:hypothetical protein T08_6124 [Trichinella sp. T8]|nr:hypothetical protein T08_6124 [Trichinella sp. T8]
MAFTSQCKYLGLGFPRTQGLDGFTSQCKRGTYTLTSLLILYARLY